MPTLPFQVEPLEVLRARFTKALERIWTMQDIHAGNRPGLHREYVFDFASGLRLLISNDNFFNEDGLVIHVSASFEFNEPKNLTEMDTKVREHYHQLGGQGRLKLLGISSGGVPHWLVENVH